MNNASKYTRQFFCVPSPTRRWADKPYIDKPPIWCSVDLRDGNQSLVVPMNLEEKLEFFRLLVSIGFKEIEVGFPAASDTEYRFLRTLIEENMIPEDVTVQVLTQSRRHIIEKTFEALRGCPRAIVHLYNPTSLVQREQVFGKSKEEIIGIATDGARLFSEMAAKTGGEYVFEYSPESFTGTEPELALEICNALLDIWQPTPQKKAIINLPVTVELSSPHIYADQVEYMCDGLKYRDSVTVSLHPHNDRGCAIADSELGLLAGAERIEGTLFGNGERTGNADIVTLALNMYAQGVEPGLDLTELPRIREIYERITGMEVHDRQPYSGKLVFAAFSGSHQDAIAKGLKWYRKSGNGAWTVPYLPIDPEDIGREYESSVIRINSQSGKGGIGYLLENAYGYVLPAEMREEVGYTVKGISDKTQAELAPSEVYGIFADTYVNRCDRIKLLDYDFVRGDKTTVTLSMMTDDGACTVSATAAGRLEAAIAAMEEKFGMSLTELTFDSHELDVGEEILAVAYMSVKVNGGIRVWGVGVSDDIITSSMLALVTAVNRSLTDD